MTLSSMSQDRDTEQPAPASLHWTGRDWAILGLLALLVALFFWRILTPNLADRNSFPPGDFSYQFWAFSTFEARELSAGRLPLWNPYTYAGAPFWADIQSAVLYPLSLLTLLLSGPWGFSLFALEVEAILHFWLAGAFTYLFVRRLTRHRGAGLIAAITFTFGGYLTGYPSQQLAVLETGVWLPLLLFFIDRALIDRGSERPYVRISPPDALAAGLVWGLALLAGHPQSAMFVFYTSLLYVIFLLLAYGGRPAVQAGHGAQGGAARLLAPLLVLLIGLGLAAIAWLPGLEYMRMSVRAGGLYEKMSGGFPLYDVIQVLLPGSVSFYSPLYVGVLPLLLAIWVALSPRRPDTTFWGGLAVGALLLSFGGETFLYSPFYLLVPGFSIFRGQERAAFIFSFSLAVLAGYGFKALVAATRSGISDHPQSRVPYLQQGVGWLLVGATGLVVLFFYALNTDGWQDSSPFNLLLSRSVWLLVLLAITWGLLRLGRRRSKAGASTAPRFPAFALATGLLLLTLLDLFTANWKTNLHPSLPEAQTAVPAVVQAIREDAAPGEIFRVFNEYRIYENYGVPYSLEDTWGASPLRLASYDAMMSTLRLERLWELLNVKYVITWRRELYAPSEIIYKEASGDEVTYVHRLEQVAPRAWLVHRVEEVNDQAALARLDAADFDPARVALVPPGTRLSLREPEENQPTGQVEFLNRAPNSLLLRATTPTQGLLVLSEVAYPGWQAAVDGRPAPILKADTILRGIAIPAGQHLVKLSYWPISFAVGAAVSVITLGGVVAAGVWMWLSRKRRAKAQSTASPSSSVG